MVTRQQAIEVLKKSYACEEGYNWFMDSGLEPEQAWNRCSQPDWLVWLAGRLGIDRNKLILVAYECAKAVLPLIPKNAERIQKVLELVGKGLDGEKVSWGDLQWAAISAIDEIDEIDEIDDPNGVYSDAAYSVYFVAHAINSFFIWNSVSSVSRAYSAYLDARDADSNIDFPGIVKKHIPWQMIEKHFNKLVEKEGIEL